MADMSFREATQGILLDAGDVLAAVRDEDAKAIEDALVEAKTVFVAGAGRSGLVAQALAARLVHLGRPCHVAGQPTTPAIGAGDLLLAISRTGETASTCLLAALAVDAGARLAVITAADSTKLTARAAVKLVIPTDRREAAPRLPQYGGSLFEQSALVLLEAIALRLQMRLGLTAEEMDSRHANLE
jgi:6-phospho-3-hexuloisomerase